MKSVKEWSTVTHAELSHLRGVCLDIDDTLSTHGKLTSEAYAALWNLKAAGFFVVPITGRPAGWCDHIARFWPVDAVVGENGAFTMMMQIASAVGNTASAMSSTPKLHRIETLAAEAGENAFRARRARLEKLGATIRARFPHAKWASDQAYRDYDLAIDFCEDVAPWSSQDVAELVAICEREGAHAKVSSIHVNAWFGDYDKRTGFEKLLSESSHFPRENEWIFVGDSPNDEPLFRTFDASVGVANLRPFLEGRGIGGKVLQNPPTWITSQASGAGFVEMATKLVNARSRS